MIAAGIGLTIVSKNTHLVTQILVSNFYHFMDYLWVHFLKVQVQQLKVRDLDSSYFSN